MLLVPLISLAGLWGFAASVTLEPALGKYAVSRAYDRIGIPGSTLSTQLQQERALSIVNIAGGGRDGGALAAQRGKTDQALAAFRRTAMNTKVSGASKQLVKQRLNELNDRLGQLAALRGTVDRRVGDRLGVIDGYGTLVASAIELFNTLAMVDDLGIYQATRALTNLSWSLEFMQRETTLVTAARLTGGRLSAQEQSALAQWAGVRRQYLQTGLTELTGDMRTPVQQVVASPDYTRFERLESSSLADPRQARLPASSADAWTRLAPRLMTSMAQAVLSSGGRLTERAKPIGDRIMVRLLVAGGLGLLAVIASVVLSTLFSRRLIRELRSLQQAAWALAERLPQLVGRLRAGERVAVDIEAPALEAGRTTEIGGVADAFTQAQRVAVQSAVGESALRRGINRVFLNLAWRSQSLLHRQLSMLDVMERRATDPDDLKDLFRLDHLTTRMRRHAEGLVILSGASPGREWSRPARLEDVVRAAVSEVEDYERVDVVAAEPTALNGGAVADVVHLLAELIENATAFSPPNTEIVVRGQTVGNGFAIEIIDRGIGIDASERARLNRLLAEPPEFDLVDTDRLGLFVVSRLAARHGIRVVLQESNYAGTTAIVILPRAIVVGALESQAPRDQVAPAPRDAPAFVEVPAETERPDFFAAAAGTGTAAEPGTPWGAADGPRPVLPRRQKLANLVPQLRDQAGGAGAGAPTGGQGRPDAPDPGRPQGSAPSAEASRSLWDSLQGGWNRGREDQEGGR